MSAHFHGCSESFEIRVDIICFSATAAAPYFRCILVWSSAIIKMNFKHEVMSFMQ